MENNRLLYIIFVCTVYYYAFQSIILLAWQHANVKLYILRKKKLYNCTFIGIAAWIWYMNILNFVHVKIKCYIDQCAKSAHT